MLSGRAWPKALRGLRMVVEALLEPFIVAGGSTVDDLQLILQEACRSRTGRLWVESFIWPVQILHMYVRAEREGDWLLHLYCLQNMVPFFFAAGHWNYTCYIHWHLQEMMSSLPEELREAFLR